MTSILIVDDEKIEREGLAAILRKGFPDLVIEQAPTGRVAVQMAERGFRPDLVLMDIKMPGLDGLETIRRLSAIDPAFRFVMVTAYDSFDYARQAIKLGVKDYILKPSKADDIIATVGKVLQQIKAERQEREARDREAKALQKVLPVVETDIVTQLLFDHVHDVHLDELVSLLGVRASDELFAIVVIVPAGEERSYAGIKAKIRTSGNGLAGALSGGQIPAVLSRDPSRSYRTQAMSVARDLLALASAGDRAGWFVGIGGPCRSLDQVRQSYYEAQIAASDPTLSVKYRFYEDMPAIGSVGGEADKAWEKRFVEHVRTGDWDNVHAEIMAFIRRCSRVNLDLVTAQQRVLEMLWIVSRMLQELGIAAETPVFPNQAQSWRQLQSDAGYLLGRIRQAYAEHQARHEPDAVHQIRKFIIEHSHEDLSLEAIGNMVGLSPFYISKIFKEQFGVNYIDFLTECRIEKAKKLMLDPDKSMKAIAIEAGYRDPNYFSKVFRKMCNISPSEYRRALLGTGRPEACDG
jgi:two-component system response regulator YesN